MSNYIALDPKCSIVVEACAGSGKTWFIVSRIVRLLLDGAQPSQILAITFTRKAAQEMQARLQLWLRDLAMSDDFAVRKFFAERGLDQLSDAQLQRARSLYSDVLLAQPAPVLLAAHSLGCALVAAWAAHSNNTHLVRGALLVAPGDEAAFIRAAVDLSLHGPLQTALRHAAPASVAHLAWDAIYDGFADQLRLAVEAQPLGAGSLRPAPLGVTRSNA